MSFGKQQAILSAVLGSLIAFSAVSAYRAQELRTPSSPATSENRSLIDQYCITCHNSRLKTGGLALDNISLDRIPDNAEIWEKVIRKLRGGMMPPQGRPGPEAQALHEFILIPGNDN